MNNFLKMECLLKQPPIVEELLQCITPIEYMVLRRACPIFIRNPTRFPTVEEMGHFEQLLKEPNHVIYGFTLLLYLHGETLQVYPALLNPNVSNRIVFSKKNGLQITNFYDILNRKLHVYTTDYSTIYLFINTPRVILHEKVCEMFNLWNFFSERNITVCVHHNAEFTFDYVNLNEDNVLCEEDSDFDEEDEKIVAQYWNKFVKLESEKLANNSMFCFIND